MLTKFPYNGNATLPTTHRTEFHALIRNNWGKNIEHRFSQTSCFPGFPGQINGIWVLGLGFQCLLRENRNKFIQIIQNRFVDRLRGEYSFDSR